MIDHSQHRKAVRGTHSPVLVPFVVPFCLGKFFSRASKFFYLAPTNVLVKILLLLLRLLITSTTTIILHIFGTVEAKWVLVRVSGSPCAKVRERKEGKELLLSFYCCCCCFSCCCRCHVLCRFSAKGARKGRRSVLVAAQRTRGAPRSRRNGFARIF